MHIKQYMVISTILLIAQPFLFNLANIGTQLTNLTTETNSNYRIGHSDTETPLTPAIYIPPSHGPLDQWTPAPAHHPDQGSANTPSIKVTSTTIYSSKLQPSEHNRSWEIYTAYRAELQYLK